MSDLLSLEDLKRHLRERQRALGNYAAVARTLGVSTSVVAQVLSGHRRPGPKLLKGLKLEQVVLYKTLKEK